MKTTTEGEVVFLLPTPKPEFQNFSEREILVALSKPRSRKHARIESEVSRLVGEYVANFKAYVAEYGRDAFLLQITVRWPIEKIAVRLMMAAVKTKAGAATTH